MAWVRAEQPGKNKRMKNQEAKPGFMARHGGKLLAGAALLGVAALNRHKIAGAVGGAKLAAAMHKEGNHGGVISRGLAAFRGARAGYVNHRGDDRIDKHTARAGEALRGLGQSARDHFSDWRKNGARDLAGGVIRTIGGMGVEHIGSRFGSIAGTAVGSFAGPAGAAIGGQLGANLGSMLASRHAGNHVERAAAWAENRVGGARPAAESPAHVAPRRRIINRARKRRTATAGA